MSVQRKGFWGMRNGRNGGVFLNDIKIQEGFQHYLQNSKSNDKFNVFTLLLSVKRVLTIVKHLSWTKIFVLLKTHFCFYRHSTLSKYFLFFIFWAQIFSFLFSLKIFVKIPDYNLVSFT